mmetsp:Transcript_47535/g.132527  ORF Transcript_47535/g.132527 Transcript_47535/m.132527 type:complete len:283 (+) Transcript_47535:2538-3386(+)
MSAQGGVAGLRPPRRNPRPCQSGRRGSRKPPPVGLPLHRQCWRPTGTRKGAKLTQPLRRLPASDQVLFGVAERRRRRRPTTLRLEQRQSGRSPQRPWTVPQRRHLRTPPRFVRRRRRHHRCCPRQRRSPLRQQPVQWTRLRRQVQREPQSQSSQSGLRVKVRVQAAALNLSLARRQRYCCRPHRLARRSRSRRRRRPVRRRRCYSRITCLARNRRRGLRPPRRWKRMRRTLVRSGPHLSGSRSRSQHCRAVCLFAGTCKGGSTFSTRPSSSIGREGSRSTSC